MAPETFRATLADLGYSATDFAAKLGLTSRCVRYWTTGMRPIPPWMPLLLDLLMAARPEPAADALRATPPPLGPPPPQESP